MIILCTGLMGSGKTYNTVIDHILPTILDGRKVRTNIPVNLEYIKEVHGVEVASLVEILEPSEEFGLPFSQLWHYEDDWVHPRTGQSTMFVIDEAQLVMPAGTSEFNKALLSKATMQRHSGYDWVLITQHKNFISRNIVDIVQGVHFFEKCTNVGRPDKYRHKVLDGTGSNAPVLKSTVKEYDPEKFKYYKSHTASAGAVEEKTSVGAHVNLRLIFWGLGLAVLALAVAVYWFYASWSNHWVDDLDDVSRETLSESVDGSPRVPRETLSPTVPRGTIKQVVQHVDNEAYSTKVVTLADDAREVVRRVDLDTSVDDVMRAPLQGMAVVVKGEMKKKAGTPVYYYDVFDQDGSAYNISSDQLVQLGYSVVKVSQCVHILDHEYAPSAVYASCHVPKFGDEKKKDPNKSATVANADAQTRTQ